MRRRIFALAAVVALLLAVGAHAAEPKLASAAPDLSFNGTTASCSVICRGNSGTDDVDVTLTLYRQGTVFVDSWSGSGTGRAYVSGSCGVMSGRSYTLTVEYTVNGVEMPSVSTTAVCP